MWPQVILSDVAHFDSGGTPSKNNPAYWNGDIPWISPKDVKSSSIDDSIDKITFEASERSAAKIVGPNSILAVVRSGILAHSFPVASIKREVSFNQDIKAITPKNGSLLPSFLFWLLKNKESYILRSGVKKGATVHSLTSGFLENLQFQLPSVEEQRRIVSILDRASTIRRRAHTARVKARALIPALFMQMFGDPAENPNGWPRVALGELMRRVSGGKNVQSGSGSSPYRIMKVSAVTSGILKAEESKPAPDSYRPKPDHYVRDSDFLFSRANTSALVGATAIANDPPPGLLLPDKIWRIEWEEDRIDRQYAHSLLWTSEIRRVFERIATGTSDSMKNISQAKLKQILIPLAPIDLQLAFKEHARRISQIARSLEEASVKAEALASSLLAEAFD